MRMPHELQDVDLSCYPLDVRYLHDFGLLQHLDGHLLASAQVGCQLNFAEGALPQGLLEQILAQLLALCVAGWD